MSDAPTAIDDLLNAFVESLRPAHDRQAAAPFSAIEVRKDELRAAAAALLEAHATYLEGALTARATHDESPATGSPAPSTPEPPAPSSAPEGGIAHA